MGAVALIVACNSYGIQAYNVGVREKGSSLDRYRPLHEAEDGGETHILFPVQTDATDGKIELYSNITGAANRAYFRIIGYLTGVDYTEKMESFWPSSSDVWQDKDIYTSYSVPMGSVCDIAAENVKLDAAYDTGVRTKGSSLSRYISMHEAEGALTGFGYLNFIVKSNETDGKIQMYGNASYSTFHLLGFFSDEIDFDEAWEQINIPTSDTWVSADLDSLTVTPPANGIVSLMLTHASRAAEEYLGARVKGSSQNRYILEHEAEENGYTGLTMTVNTDSENVVELYAGSAANEYFMYQGFFSEVGGGTAYYQTCENTIVVADSITRVTTYRKTFDEGVGAADTVGQVTDFHKLIENDVGITEILERVTDFHKLIENDVEITETLIRNLIIRKLLEENVSVDETLATVKIYHQLLEDGVQVDEALTQAIKITLENTAQALEVTGGDAGNFPYTFPIIWAPTNIYLTIVAAYHKLFEEGVSASDDILNKILLNFDESITASDNVTSLIKLLLSEACSVSEILTIAAALSKILTNTVNVSETITHFIKTTLSESVSVSDTIALIFTLLIEDSVQVVETLSKITAFKKEFLESAEVQDSEVIKAYEELLETVIVTDEITAILIFKQLLENTINVSEDISQKIGITLEESVQLQETLSKITHFAQLFQEAVTVIETVTSLTSITLSEQVTVAETLIKSGLLRKLLQESITVNETLGIIEVIVYKNVIMSLDLRTRKLIIKIKDRELTLSLDTRKMEIEME